MEALTFTAEIKRWDLLSSDASMQYSHIALTCFLLFNFLLLWNSIIKIWHRFLVSCWWKWWLLRVAEMLSGGLVDFIWDGNLAIVIASEFFLISFNNVQRWPVLAREKMALVAFHILHFCCIVTQLWCNLATLIIEINNCSQENKLRWQREFAVVF